MVPVLGRPHRVVPLLDAIENATPDAHVFFLADPQDRQEHEAIEAERCLRSISIDLNVGGGNYAMKINRGVRLTDQSLLFFGADDLAFHRGWLEAATAKLTDGIGLVGTNDLIDRRPSRADHATHFLVTREYAQQPLADGQPGPLCEEYDHSWVDNEFIATAESRGTYVYEPTAHVEHLHPMNGKAPDDTVYQKGRQQFHEDQRIFERRSRLWRR